MILGTTALHLLCFGDSLTHGFTDAGRSYHPYSLALTSSLLRHYPSFSVKADEHGQNGDQVTSPPGQFLPRMNELYEYMSPKDPYDWAIILGGTNDVIGNLRLAGDTYEALQKVWAVPLSRGTKVLALTIPECGHCIPEVNRERDVLNEYILDHHAENFYTFDLGAAVPYWDLPLDERNEIWDDTIHFTAKGYDLIGTLLAKTLIEIRNAESSSRPPKAELRRRNSMSKGHDLKLGLLSF